MAIPFVLFGLWIGVAAAYSIRKRWQRVAALSKPRRLWWLGVFGALMFPFALATVAVGFALVIIVFSVRP